MKGNSRFLAIFLIWLSLSLAGVQAAKARTFSTNETAPLPPPTPTADAGEVRTAALDEPFTLHIGDWATLSDTPEELSVQVAEFVSDNRCPAKVNCVVAGQVEFMLRVRMGNVVHRQLFPIGTYPMNDGNKVRYGGYEIELTGVEPPAPPPDEELAPSQYEATLLVRVAGNATPAPTALPTATPTPQDDQGDGQGLTLDQPFTLQVGETATLDDIDFRVTLRSLSEDSGCVTADDCSLMLAEGTLVLQEGDDREVLTFSTSFTPEQPFTYEYAGYVVQLAHVEQGRDGNQVATFVIQKPQSTVEIPAPQRVERCPLFSRFDAAAMLQEEVDTEAVVNLVFGPLPADATAAAGLCGYVTTAFSDARQIDEQAPALLSEVAADRAVVVETIDSSDSTRLLQLANLVTAADPAAQTDTLLRLQAHLTAGDTADFIRDVADMAAADPTFTVEPLANRNEEGVWLWQQTQDGYFALLLLRDGERFQVVVALLNGEAEERTVRGYALVVTGQQEQGTINEVPPTPQVPPDAPAVDCDLITVDDAAAILGEAVHEPVAVAGEDGSCLYVPDSEEALTPEEAAVSQPDHGVITQIARGADVTDQLSSLAEEIKSDNPDADEDLFNLIQSQLIAGDTEGALELLPNLADGAEKWTVEAADDLMRAAVFLWFTEEDQTYSALLTTDPTGNLKLLIASLPTDRDQDEVREAFITAASAWAE